MDSYHNNYMGGIMQKRRFNLPFWADDIGAVSSSSLPDCVIIRIKRDDINWVIIVSETASAIKTTAFGLDSFSVGKNGTCSGYILHRSLPKVQKSTSHR